ncbi:lytic transglycosylase domain-containing protein [Acetohalobium arabaticum]|uniref:Lytic transglycosylase catalytic n=1 Tax=Acetohalobium arabaticum (strain ATCC 49924 / DSM 5501 / Z-7288) TaxID=574087 RepID=D9QUA1_ACEAZ|nr:lytic transglycosylase domain-containing protein [Acetohalobium arabaticum]ADL11894.1 Lytic transglycosylase catalytic [Acetohalobium arabaticum DSM 5501]
MVIGPKELKIILIILLCLIISAVVIINFKNILKIFYPLYYEDLIFKYAEKNNLDPYLVAAVIRVESKFNSEATSRQGARGLMQIMPETGEWIADQLKIDDFDTDDLYDPEVNISFGSWYLAHLKRFFDGNLTVVIAAYNGGQGNVNKWLELKEWTGKEKDSKQIPFPETRDYVEKVLNTYQWYHKIYRPETR